MKKKKIFGFITTLLTSIIFLFSLYILIFGTISTRLNKKFDLFGYSFSYVPTTSMVPTINPDDIIVFKDFKYDDLEVGDIIVYYNNSYDINVVHRIVSKDNKGIITKGDNNSSNDSIIVTKDNYLGKVVKYGPMLGIGKIFKNNKNFIFSCLILIFLYILISESVNIVKIIKKKNKDEYNKRLSEIDNKKLDEEKIRKEIIDELTK